MNVTLIVPPLLTEKVYGKFSALAPKQVHLGLCYLASVLKNSGHKVKIIDPIVMDWSIHEVLAQKEIDDSDLFGIYVNSATVSKSTELAQKIKLRNKKAIIVSGGPHISANCLEFLRHEAWDFAVHGEGELTLNELVMLLENGNTGDINKVNGLIYKGENGEIIINKPRKYIDNLDSLPFPSRDLLPPLNMYKPYLHYKRLPLTPILTSRGCPYQCVFCTTPFGRKVRFHSPEYVVSEVESLVRDFGVRELLFTDDTFTLNKDRVNEICRLIKKRKIDIPWYCTPRADMVDRDLFEEMKSAGCWIIAIGVESGNQGVLRTIKKQIKLEEVKRACELARKAGLMLKTFFIIGHPTETEATIEDTIKFAQSLKPHFPVFSLMTPYPGTELWDKAAQYGKFDKSAFDSLLLATSKPVFIPYGLSEDILIKKQREAFRRLYFNLPMALRHLKSIKNIGDLKRLVRGFINGVRALLMR